MCATLGYFALYRALEIGPIAIVGPLTATSPIFTLILSAFILKEHLTLERKGLVIIGILGIILASTSLTELRALLKKPGFSLWSQGVRWAVVATFAFGALDFGIGASASVSNWFLPALKDIAHLRHPLSKNGLGVLLALLVGIMECVAVLAFSLDTRIATTGITSAIASSYALVIMIFGMIVYRERLAKNQLLGIVIFMISLFSLAL